MVIDRCGDGRRTAPGHSGGRLGVHAWGLALLLLVAPGALAAQFAVHPVQVEVRSAGMVSAESITVENQADERLEVVVYLSDYDRAENGGHSYLPFGDHPNTCAGRLEAFPDQLSLEPDEDGEIRVQLQPDGGTCWGILFVEKQTVTPSGITVSQRIGVKLLSEPEGLAREGRVLGVAADTSAEPAALLAFENQGQGALDVRGEIEVRDLEGEVVSVVEVEPFRVLPGRVRRTRVGLAGAALEPGPYLMVAILDFGGEYLTGGQAMIEVQP